ncbi:MAG: choice-of-anchor D domain-containing protein [Burkholderiaceae bacterium]|nr:choice-of-anchor D domain-containing protein [Burkholderiaceae bacterium]
MKPVVLALRALAAAALLAAAAGAAAQNAVRGKALYFNTNGAPLSCGSTGCHNGFPAARINNISRGTSAAVIQSAIATNKGGMGFLSAYVNAQDAADIAAYIANPAAGDGTPAIALSATTLTFAAQTVGTTSAAQTVTVSNTGTAPLSLTALTLGGAHAGDFTRAGTCAAGGTVAPGGNCTVQIAFAPTAAGARSATLSIAHGAAGSPSTVALSGTAQAAPASASVAPAALAFTQTVNTTSAAQTVTLTNSGGMPLALTGVTLGGANAAEFALAGGTTCAAGASLAGGASCVVRVTFTPAATGARSATLSIAHGAAGSPATVALNGTGTAAPQPAASLSAASLTFGNVAIGATSAAQTVTLTNTGQAALALNTITLGGAAAADFTRAGTCANGASVAAGASCTLQIAFAPTARGARSATLTVASNAANGAQTLALAGNGLQAAIAVSPATASLQAAVGARSTPAMVALRNDGVDALTIDAVTVRGPFALGGGANACATPPFALAGGQSCNQYVVFEARAAGAASGELEIRSNAVTTPARVSLSAQATPAAGGNAGAAPSNLGYGGCSAGAPDQLFDPLLLAMLSVALLALARRRRR